MRKEVVTALVAVALVLGGCGGSFVRVERTARYVNDNSGTTTNQAYGLFRACPAGGTRREALIASFGRPDSVSVWESRSVWVYHLQRGSPVLAVHLAGDTVEHWDIERLGGRGLRSDDVSGSKVRESVERYVGAGVPVTDRVLYAMLRRCLVVGMTAAEVRAVHGEPDAGGTTQQWVYHLGLEGQRLDIQFRNDSVLAWSFHDHFIEWR